MLKLLSKSHTGTFPNPKRMSMEGSNCSKEWNAQWCVQDVRGETAHGSTSKLQPSMASWPTSAACGAELAALWPRTLWAARVPAVSVCGCPSWGFEGKQAWQGVRSGGAGPSVYVWSRRLRAHDDLLTQELPSTACQKLIRGGRILFKKPLGQGCLAWGWKCKQSHSSSGSSTPKVSKQLQAGKSDPGPGPGWGGPATMRGPAVAGRSIHWSAPEPIFSQGSLLMASAQPHQCVHSMVGGVYGND